MTHDEKEIAAFRAALDPKDRIIHDLAIRMLKTRYDPLRCNAFLEWKKKQTKP